MNLLTQLSAQQLRAAADLQEKIQGLQNELNQALGTESHGRTALEPVISEAPAEPMMGRKKRNITAAGRAAMAAAGRARWAKVKAAKSPGTPEPEKPKKKRKMTEAWRQALARAHAARRAKARAASSLVPAEKSAKRKVKLSEAKLKALAKAREARWAKVRAAKDDVPF